jgi:hypothetical protein
VLELTNVSGALVHGCQVERGAPLFLAAADPRAVTMVGNSVRPDRMTAAQAAKVGAQPPTSDRR